MKKKTQQIRNDVCQVCLTDDPPQKARLNKDKNIQNERRKALQLYTCSGCKLNVHKYCYDPTIQDSKTFKCDICKHQAKNRKTPTKICHICKNVGTILKCVQQNKFVHIQCALTSEQLVLQNFKTLKFKFKSSEQSSVAKKSQGKKCMICIQHHPQLNSVTSDSVLKCYYQNCQKYAHFNCIQQNKSLNIQDYDLLYNLLNLTCGSFRVKNSQYLRKNNSILKGLNLISKLPKTHPPLITCSQHSLKVIWCTECFQVGDTDKLLQCSKCLRWCHEKCSKMKNKSAQAYFQCNACMYNQVFLQRSRFPQIIYNMVQIQTSQNSLDTQNQKFLDSFSFKCSVQLQNKILNPAHSFDFQYYQLYQYLDKEFLQSFFSPNKPQSINAIVEKIDNKFIKSLNQKHVIQIMYYMKYRQIRKSGQFTSTDINSLRDVYPNKKTQQKKNAQLLAKQQNKRKIIDKILEVYIKNMKQAELKDISMKFLELKDKINRQVKLLEEGNFNIDPSLSKEQYLDELGIVLKKKPMHIALDLRQALRMLIPHKQKLRTKLDIDFLALNSQQDGPQTQQQSKSTKKKLNLYNNFLMTIIKCLISKDQGHQNQFIQSQDLQNLLNCYRKIIYVAFLNQNKHLKRFTLPEQQYYKITNLSYNQQKTHISQQSKIKLSKFFRNLLKQSKIKQSFQTKLQLAEKYDQLISQDKLTYKQMLVLKQNIASQGIFVDKHSKIITQDKRRLYYKILKRKYIKLVESELALSDNKNGYNYGESMTSGQFKIVQNKRKEVLDGVKRLIEANGKGVLLTEDQKNSFQYFLVKEEVFNNILKEEYALGSKLDIYNPQPINQDVIKQQQDNSQFANNSFDHINKKSEPQKPLTTFQRIRRIFLYWINNVMPSSYHIIKILFPIAQKNIKFPLQYQEIFDQLLDSLGQRYNMYMNSTDHLTNNGHSMHHRINSDQFMKLWKLIQYAGLDHSYNKLATLSRQYTQWLYDLENRFNPIAKALQDSYQNGQLLSTIDKKISDAQRFQIDLKTQIKKLKLVKLWSTLSQKFIKDFQRKPTISAIQQFKQLMIKINYPHNKIYQKVIDLETYGRQLNQKIQKYLKKTKQEDLELYQQLVILKAKMTLVEAENLRTQLDNCKLDVSAELQELEDQIANFNQIPSKIESLIKKGELQQLLRVKSKITDTPIRYQNLQSYCQLYHKISYLKCYNLTQQSSISKKQYMRLLNTSDLGSTRLIQRFPHLLKGYKQIQKAQKQLISTKPKFQNMLSIQNGKKLRNQLNNDPTTQDYIDKIYRKVEALRQKFRKYKSERAYFDKYQELEYQLSHYPINYKDIQSEITKNKRQLEMLEDRAQMLKKNFNPKQANDLLRTYRNNIMKSKTLEQLKKISQCYDQCMVLCQNVDQYPRFSAKCRQYRQLQSQFTINDTRSQLFEEYYCEFVEDKSLPSGEETQNKKNANIGMLNTLLQEGSHLLNYVYGSKNPKKRTDFLQKLLKINKKIVEQTMGPGGKQKKSLKGRYNDQMIEDGSDQYPDSEDDEDSDNNERPYSQQEDEYDYDEEDEDQEQESYNDQQIPQPPKKRSAQPLVMEISDEDEMPAEPEVRKLVNTGQQNASAPIQAVQLNSQNQQIQNLESSQKQ